MNLAQAKSQEDIAAIYQEQNLIDVEEKINFLKKEMRVRASRYDIEDTPEEELIGLETLALTHMWEGLR